MHTRSQSLKSRAIVGSIWTLGGYGSSQMLRLGSNVVLAWILFPEVFGLMALVKVFQQGLKMFSDVGIGPSIIRSDRGDQPEFLNTAWTIQIIRGFALWLITLALAAPVAYMFSRNDPVAWQLAYLLPVAAFSSVLQGFNSTALFTLNRELRLGRLTSIEIASQIVSITVMITWALIHPTIWAMVAGGLSSALFTMILSHRIVPGHRVRMGWDADCSKELFRFGKWIFLSTLVTFVALHMDRVVLGNIIPMSELGIYAIAMVFARVALHTTTRLSSTVLYPVLSKFRDQPERLVAVCIRSRELVLWAGGAVCACMAVASPLFFTLLYDDRYSQAGVVAQWLAILIWANILTLSMDRIPLALGNSRILFSANMVRCFGIVFAIIGYSVSALPGFILGLSLGVVITHLYVLLGVPDAKKAILSQSLRFTGIVGAYSLAGVVISTWVQANLATEYWIGAVVVLSAVPLACAAWMVWQLLHERKSNVLQHPTSG